MERIHGSSFNHQSLTGSLQHYICFVSSPGAYTLPDPNPVESEMNMRRVNIQVTMSLKDQSQRNFEILLQSIGLRAMPVIMSNPQAVLSLAASEAPSLTGEGFIWKFAVERNDVFNKYINFVSVDPVGLLIDELDGVILDSNVRLTTVDNSPSGISKNIEFIRKDSF
jgi:hypothetical protein